MATKTLGSLATTTLTGVQANPSISAVAAADIATLGTGIFFDQASDPRGYVTGTIVPGALETNGLLTIPGRGTLKILPNDWVAYDTAGFPYLIPSKSLPKTLTLTGNTHTSTLLDTLSASCITAGWEVGTPLTGSGLAANTVIAAIAKNGLSLTLSKATTTSVSTTTITAGAWTHS